MRETDILYQIGRYWVRRSASLYLIMIDGMTHATSDPIAYADLSVAIARCNYLARQDQA